jgi:hypothetical protein
MMEVKAQTIPVKSWYIHGKVADTFWIILNPILALLVVFFICEPRHENYIYSSLTPVWFSIAASILTHAHVLLVFTRSHFNKEVFNRFKYRFTIVPLFFLTITCAFSPLFLLASVVAVYWDEWHSLMQTFGFGRIYDGKLGNDPLAGRKLDMAMAFVVGLLPNIVLLTFLPESQIDKALLEYMELPNFFASNYRWIVHALRLPLIGFGITYTLFYTWSYFKLVKNGYRYSYAKLALFLTTGLTTVIVSSVYTIADGVFFGNIYHALQYIFIVMVTERPNLGKIASKDGKSNIKIGSLIFFIIVIPNIFFFAGIRQMTEKIPYVAAFWLMTSLLHFWFDGFIWSVRRKDIV